MTKIELGNNNLSGTIPSELDDLNLDSLKLENPPYVKKKIPDTPSIVGVYIKSYFGDINNNITNYGAKGLPNHLAIDSSEGFIYITSLNIDNGNFSRDDNGIG
ncbi:MAG: hypothetical protein GDA48_07715 [Hormoscilla sp. GM102CHS1]|nr:hypothetical protein [Hormoscilla sp. GM102CHS1]